MSTTSSSTATPPGAASGGGLSAILIPVLLSTLLTLGAVGGGIFWLLHSGKLGGAAAAPPGPAAAATVPSHVVALEPMIVNLADGRSYLRAGISLRMRDDESAKKEEAPKDPKGVDGAVTALRDTTLTVLSTESADGLLAPDGRAGLKKALQAAYQQHNEDAHVLEVYFTEFLVQRG